MTDVFSDTPDAVACEVPIERRPRRRKPLIDKLGTVEPPAKRKKVNLNPKQQEWLREHGFTFANVERDNPYGGVKQDLWKAFDYIAVHPEHSGTFYIQVTTLDNASSRRKKVRDAPETTTLLQAQNRAQLFLWHQPKGPGTKWQVKIEEVTL